MASPMVSNKDEKLLKAVKDSVLYVIASDIQATNSWLSFGISAGFTLTEIKMWKASMSNESESRIIIHRWSAYNATIKDLADVLCELSLEKSIYYLKDYLEQETFEELIDKLRIQKEEYNANSQQMSEYYSTTHVNSNVIVNDQKSENNSLFETLSSQIDLSDKSSDNGHVSYKHDSVFTLLKSRLQKTSTNFNCEEFGKVSNKWFQGQFSSYFVHGHKSSKYFVQSFSLSKMLDKPKDKRRLYNIIWCYQNYKHSQLPLLRGFSFYDDYLLLFFPFQNYHTLEDILHRSHIVPVELSGNERLSILVEIGHGLSFLHDGQGIHGQVTSNNVLIANRKAILTGFDKFYSQVPKYIEGLDSIKQYSINVTDCLLKDIIKYIELMCETWWNVQQFIAASYPMDSRMIKDVSDCSISNPRVKYCDWNEIRNEKMRSCVKKCYESKENITITKIAEQLSTEII